jgi:hypothetical protein
VTTIEDRLRDAYRAAAETIQPETIPDLLGGVRPARSRHARALISLAVAAAVTAVVTALAVSPALIGIRNGHRVDTPALPPGVPRFYVEARGYSTESALEVYETATGRVVAIIKPPTGMYFDNQVEATARDHTFVTAASPGSGLGSPKRCVTQFYTFQLNDAGQPGPLIPLHVTVPGEEVGRANTISVTPDGRRIAYATDFGYCPGLTRVPAEVGVINVPTRQARFWTLGQRGIPAIFGVALSADGSQLAFTRFAQLNSHSRSLTLAAQILPTNAPPGPVDQRGRVVFPSAFWVALNADGRLLYACHAAAGPRGGVAYEVYSIASGQRQVIASFPPHVSALCGASLDPSGRYLLIQLIPDWPPGNRLVVVDLRTRERRSLPPGHSVLNYGGEPLSIAW